MNVYNIKGGAQSLDRTSQEYFTKIAREREFQKKMLPLYLESQRLVAMHKRCISTILSENSKDIPHQLNRIMDKGQAGLESYGQLLKNIQSTLAKNNELTQKLSDYQSSVITVKKRAG